MPYRSTAYKPIGMYAVTVVRVFGGREHASASAAPPQTRVFGGFVWLLDSFHPPDLWACSPTSKHQNVLLRRPTTHNLNPSGLKPDDALVHRLALRQGLCTVIQKTAPTGPLLFLQNLRFLLSDFNNLYTVAIRNDQCGYLEWNLSHHFSLTVLPATYTIV